MRDEIKKKSYWIPIPIGRVFQNKGMYTNIPNKRNCSTNQRTAYHLGSGVRSLDLNKRVLLPVNKFILKCDFRQLLTTSCPRP